MARPTNTERIDELSTRLTEESTAHRERLIGVINELQRHDQQQIRIQSQIEGLLQRVSTLEAKIQSLEQHSNRTWGVWLAVFGALLALAAYFLRR